MRALNLTLIAGLLLGLPVCATAQRINGRVVDAMTLQPIAAVTVRLFRGDKEVYMTVADSAGQFLLRAPHGGRYRLTGSRIGYADAQSRVVELGPEETISAELMMSSEAVKIAPLSVSATRNAYLDSKGFYERQKTGTGDFRTGDEIRRRNPMTLVDVLRTMRGLKIQRVTWTDNEVYFAGANCLPEVVVDGITMRYGGKSTAIMQGLDEMINVQHVEAIEAYRGGSGAPTEFVGPNAGCGVIVIWTRHR